MKRYLLDSGVWWRYQARGPLAKGAVELIEADGNELWISPLSVYEILRKISRGKLSAPRDTAWQDRILAGYRMTQVTGPAARLAAEWPWENRDPFDRMLAATAKIEGLTLVHTDTVLKGLAGFPQLYFKAPSENPPD